MPKNPPKPENGNVAVISGAEQFKLSMSGGSLSSSDLANITRLPALYAYAFDSCQSDLAAELFTEDAFAMGAKGKDAIVKGYTQQMGMRRAGKFKLRSRHIVTNLVIRPDENDAKTAHGSVSRADSF